MSLLDSGAIARSEVAARAKPEPPARLRVNPETASQFLKTMANPGRLMILCLLAKSGRELSVGELEAGLGIRQPALSQQLARLREDDLVETKRKGKSILYRIANERAMIVALLVQDWFAEQAE